MVVVAVLLEAVFLEAGVPTGPLWMLVQGWTELVSLVLSLQSVELLPLRNSSQWAELIQYPPEGVVLGLWCCLRPPYSLSLLYLFVVLVAQSVWAAE